MADLESSEAFVSGWVTTAVVLNNAGRVLLAYDAEEDHWLIPDGTVQPGENLREAVVRELEEETGVSIVPERPHAVSEVLAVCAAESATFRVVTFEASPESTDVGDDLGVGDERITEAG